MFDLGAAGTPAPQAAGPVLSAAVFCLVVALLCARRALTPIGPLVRAFAAAMIAALAAGAALLLLVVLMARGLPSP
ncbi:hypothetical protein [Actinoplanes sp. NPDC051851]|uniref:hypothetical protein n=1 Tax=Actinoplanes sp. NPDC051851 TaxID=3154753 RepID=UPI00341D81F1